MSKKQTHPGRRLPSSAPSRASGKRGRSWTSGSAPLVMLFCGALLVRVIYVLEIRANSPFWNHPFLDARYYLEWARAILSGSGGVEGIFVRAPGYPYFLAAIGAVFQLHHGTIAVAQALLGSASCVLVALIGRRIWGDRIGLAAGWVAAFHGALIYWGGEILIETLFIFQLLLMVLFVLEAGASPGASPESSIRADRPVEGVPLAGSGDPSAPRSARHALLWWLAAGAAGGLAAITRPTGLPLLLVLPLCALLANPRGDRRQSARAAAVALGTALAIVGAVTVRNALVGGDFVPVASHGGINFWTGNNAKAAGKIVVIPEGIQLPPGMKDEDNIIALATVGAERDLGRRLKPSEVSAYWVRRAFSWMASNPWQAAVLQLRKLYYFWAGCEYTNNEDIYDFRKYSVLLSALLLPLGPVYLPGALIMPLALYGFWLKRGESRRWIAVYATVAIYMVTVVAFFVSSRHRLPVVPLCLPFAVGGAVALLGRRTWRAPGRRRLGSGSPADLTSVAGPAASGERRPGDALRERWSFVAAVALLLFLGINLDARPQATRTKFAAIASAIWTERAGEAEASGQPDRALALYEQALSEDPGDALTHYRVALLHGRSGRFRESEEHLRRTLAATPNDPVVLTNLALSCAYQGKKEEARQLLERARSLGGQVDPRLEAIIDGAGATPSGLRAP